MRKLSVYLLLVGLLLFEGCSIDKRIANRFVKNSSSAEFVLYMTDCLDKVNARFDFTDEEIDTMNVLTRDSIIDSKIQVVNKLEDDIVLEVFHNSFVNTLSEEYGVSVRDFEPDSIFPDSLHWVIYVPKIEIEESKLIFFDELYYMYHPEDITVTNINFALWMEINDGEWGKVLYGEQNMEESPKSSSHLLFKNLYYPLQIDSIGVADVYNFTAYAGRLYASYAYDYLLNNYVRKKLYAKGLKTSRYFRYNPVDGSLCPTEEEKFIENE